MITLIKGNIYNSIEIHMGFILELQKILLAMYANIIAGTPITQHNASAVIFEKLQYVFYFLSVSIYLRSNLF